MNKRSIALPFLVLSAFVLSAGFAYGQQHQPEYVYVSDGGIAGFSVNRSTGALTAVPQNGSSFLVSGPLVASPTGQFVFGGGLGITIAAIDRATGELTAVPGSPFADSLTISALAVTPNGHFLIAASGNSLYTYSVDGEIGALTPTGPPTSLPYPASSLAVTPSSNFVYAYLNESGALLGFAISPQTGALTPFLTFDQAGSNPIISADGGYLYTIGETYPYLTDSINAYSINAQSGLLNPVPGSPFAAAASEQPLLAIDPTGRFLYEVAVEQTASLAGYLINPLNGAIEDAVIGSPFAIPFLYPAGAVIDHSGHFLYIPNGDEGVIDGFALNSVTGSVAAIAGTMPQIFGPSGITTTAPAPATTATLISLAIEPANPSVLSGETTTEQFTVVGKFSDGSRRFLTASVTWSSSVPSVASISNAPGQSGLAAILSDGSTAIGAALEGVSAQTTLTVAPAKLVSIAVTPAAPAVVAGTAIQFTATGTFADGSMQNLTNTAAWKSSDATVAGVTQTGVAKGNAAGTATIQASSGTITGSTGLTVIAAER